MIDQEYQLFAVNDPDKSQEAIIGHAASRISLDSDSRNETARILNLEPVSDTSNCCKQHLYHIIQTICG